VWRPAVPVRQLAQPNPAVPNGRIGVYTVWRDDRLIYVGMAGRALGPGQTAPDWLLPRSPGSEAA